MTNWVFNSITDQIKLYQNMAMDGLYSLMNKHDIDSISKYLEDDDYFCHVCEQFREAILEELEVMKQNANHGVEVLSFKNVKERYLSNCNILKDDTFVTLKPHVLDPDIKKRRNEYLGFEEPSVSATILRSVYKNHRRMYQVRFNVIIGDVSDNVMIVNRDDFYLH